MATDTEVAFQVILIVIHSVLLILTLVQLTRDIVTLKLDNTTGVHGCDAQLKYDNLKIHTSLALMYLLNVLNDVDPFSLYDIYSDFDRYIYSLVMQSTGLCGIIFYARKSAILAAAIPTKATLVMGCSDNLVTSIFQVTLAYNILYHLGILIAFAIHPTFTVVAIRGIFNCITGAFIGGYMTLVMSYFSVLMYRSTHQKDMDVSEHDRKLLRRLSLKVFAWLCLFVAVFVMTLAGAITAFSMGDASYRLENDSSATFRSGILLACFTGFFVWVTWQVGWQEKITSTGSGDPKTAKLTSV